MKKSFKNPEFFLGANTPYGFYSIFDQLYSADEGWFCHILKGGPGTGKSTLMKKVSQAATKKYQNHEVIRCSSDPKSLDAVILQDSKTCIVDGTAPHVIDPIYPGVSDEIINLGEHWNAKTLQKSKEKVIKLCKENSKFHKISERYLAALGFAFRSTSKIISECIIEEKLEALCNKFTKKLFKKPSDENPKEKLRFVTSITPDGYIFLSKTADELCKKLIIINDDYGILGSYILKFIKSKALSLGHSVISCPCPFSPAEDLEALFITDINIGIIVKNQYAPKNFLSSVKIPTEKINTKKFIEKEKFSKSKNLVSFNGKICKEFLEQSILNLSEARKTHDQIEEIYIKSMNYSKINKITQKLESL